MIMTKNAKENFNISTKYMIYLRKYNLKGKKKI